MEKQGRVNTVGNRPISKLWFESKVRFFAHSSESRDPAALGRV